MRGRRPLPLRIAPDDAPLLQEIARSWSLPWYQVQRARIVLGVAAGEPTHDLALRTQCDRSTICVLPARLHESFWLSCYSGGPRLGGPRWARVSISSYRLIWNAAAAAFRRGGGGGRRAAEFRKRETKGDVAHLIELRYIHASFLPPLSFLWSSHVVVHPQETPPVRGMQDPGRLIFLFAKKRIAESPLREGLAA